MSHGPTTWHARKVLRNSLKDFGFGKNDIQGLIQFELEFFMEQLEVNNFVCYQNLLVTVIILIIIETQWCSCGSQF